jgi:hypothetical protein
MANRGELTPWVAAQMRNFFGREGTTVELRLIPYVAYAFQNGGKLDPNKINQQERDVLRQWKTEGHFSGGAGGIEMTRDFWDFMSGIIWWSYCCYEQQPEFEEVDDAE